MPITNRKIFHICMIIVIIVVIFFTAGVIILRYQVEGEINPPFNIGKIAIISSVEGKNVENPEIKWNYNVNQNNDIYLYIQKNNNYGKTEIIKSVKINNMKIEKTNKSGEPKIYKPTDSSKEMFSNDEDKEVKELIYTGELESDIKNLKISNQGGIVAFRYAINNIGMYSSNEVDEIEYNKLLQLINVNKEDLETKILFDLEIKVESGKTYLANISLDLPLENTIEEGTTSIELTDLQNVIFKRIEN